MYKNIVYRIINGIKGSAYKRHKKLSPQENEREGELIMVIKLHENNGNIYHTIDWFILQETVLDRDEHRCRVCGRRALVAHHLTYAFGILCNPRWLISLCWRCHFHIHWQRRKVEELNESI